MNKLEIFTDGSATSKTNYKFQDSKLHGTISFGIFCEYNNKKYVYNEICSQEFYINQYGSKVKNPTMELLAVKVALEKLEGIKNTEITIYSDYEGIGFWIEGSWSANKEYINDILLDIFGLIQLHKSNNNKLNFKWVKGHNGNIGNEKADKLATEITKEEDTLSNLLKENQHLLIETKK